METKLREYLDSGNYLPNFMKDFHDQKTLLKRLNRMVENRDDEETKQINWVSAQVYTIDIFLWYMAAHGYTLQKSRKDVPFYDINHDLSEFEKKQREESVSVLKQIMDQI
ncbi:hypothetical protein ACFVS2_21325 [Brevibacillus sp. NPDC058079]|uniref:hypothetical protein n=1 Tax=Brevibacillus sp. NPDC058079 TaxID=3346330 RepID=UPI0036E52178